MRIAVAIGLLAAAGGCNKIFGLDDVHGFDAPQDITNPEAPLPGVFVSFQVAKTKLDAVDAGPDPVLQQAPISGTSVKFGTLDGALVDGNYRTDGLIEIPPTGFFGTKWRLEIKPPFGPPVELQWTPVPDSRFVFPIFGRLERTPPPVGSGYIVTTPNHATYSLAHLLTTGVWLDVELLTPTNSPVLVPSNAQTLDQIAPLSGTKGVPDAAGDLAFLMQFKQNVLPVGKCLVSNGQAAFQGLALTGTKAPVTTSFVNTTRSVTVSDADVPGPFFRLTSALDVRRMGTAPAGTIAHGYIPHDKMPVFTQDFDADPGVPAPLMIRLAKCPLETPAVVDTFSDPAELVGRFPRIAYAEFSSRRAVLGNDLVSSIAMVTTTGANTLDVTYPVPFALDPIQLSDGTATFPLSNVNDGGIIPAGTGTLDLTFQLDTIGTADFFEVTVFRLDMTLGLIPQRVYIATDVAVTAGIISAPIRIDRASLTPGDYVLSIRTHHGRPGAATGDFTQVVFPQAVATVFTNTFNVQ